MRSIISLDRSNNNKHHSSTTHTTTTSTNTSKANHISTNTSKAMTPQSTTVVVLECEGSLHPPVAVTIKVSPLSCVC